MVQGNHACESPSENDPLCLGTMKLREIVEVSHDELKLLTSMLDPLSCILIPVQVTSLGSACPNGKIVDIDGHGPLEYQPMMD
jgi:hypothetical protein